MRGETAFCQTSVVIPLELKERALREGICLAGTLTQALQEQMEKRAGGDKP